VSRICIPLYPKVFKSPMSPNGAVVLRHSPLPIVMYPSTGVKLFLSSSRRSSAVVEAVVLFVDRGVGSGESGGDDVDVTFCVGLGVGVVVVFASLSVGGGVVVGVEEDSGM
jgi:hypothetical protein